MISIIAIISVAVFIFANFILIVPLVPFFFTFFSSISSMTGILDPIVENKSSKWVISCKVSSFDQQKLLIGLVEREEIDLWNDHIPPIDDLFMALVEREKLVSILHLFECSSPKTLYDFEIETKVLDLRGVGTGLGAGFFSNFQSYSKIVNQLDSYVKKYPDLIQKFSIIGKSIEGRDIPVIHIGRNKANPTIWISAGQHAREWIGPMALLYTLDQLLIKSNNQGAVSGSRRKTNDNESDIKINIDDNNQNQSGNSDMKINSNENGNNSSNDSNVVNDILTIFNFAIAPVVNPDGYEHSHQKNRYWRKNRRVHGGGMFGVDLNRNWDIQWGNVGASKSPKSDIYCGAKAESEPEVQSVAAYIKSLKGRILGIDVHSFGMLVLRNYGWKLQPTDREDDLARLGDAMANAMNQVSQDSQRYKSQRSADLYPSSGSMDDWLFEKARIPGFTIELRDKGYYGFVIPPKFIVPTGEELLAAIVTVAEELKRDPVLLNKLKEYHEQVSI